MPVSIGELYSRSHISSELEGDPQFYLPQRSGRIVCGCFIPEMNPNAPEEVLKQANKDKAVMLMRQDGKIPVFLKRAPGKWEYMGYYAVIGESTTPTVLRRKAQKVGREVTKIRYFARATEPL